MDIEVRRKKNVKRSWELEEGTEAVKGKDTV